ncbi:TlpA family protein disulfide reductase [Mameliella sediminis]|uniref:TlpA family protein disulfide reductase n=1 Tax=Mameliella sediminis TaxID=2836866 RepID=UPI001C482DD0|nr:TlpA disulfide reductase family protein [Mameliella sediminis]MBY6114148.1 TlpA family protein disulfide reductase [Antarctobacter heliothermus]MBY6142504.1 TlpA family protein disulfide reductase [Mameliella alba]MBV7395445.1 TlpA family protein disulfide reductase [Mameliella sediminis]MBY6159332.1 TlpA family protein disulfide reductase [Mameliella alba]MBY6167803.1 TlpA family protein disulfide reductase [Mameliella alba]
MKRLTLAALYTAAVMLANPVVADVEAAKAVVAGDMRKMVFHNAPKDAGDVDFMTFDEAPLNLSDWKGKWVVVNFWATWCAPCRKEMPMLSELQEELGGEGFEVLTIATSRNPPAKMKAFFDEIGVTNLPLHRDPKSMLARQMGVLGLPVTVILNPEGQEVARLTGDADWSSDSARAVLEALMGGEG